MLDGGGTRPFFLFPHRRERVIRRLGKVVEWVEYSLQNEVLHKEDEKVMVWVVLVGGFPKAHWAQTMALVWDLKFDHCDQMG